MNQWLVSEYSTRHMFTFNLFAFEDIFVLLHKQCCPRIYIQETLLTRMDNPNTLTHSFTQITLTLRFPCHPPAVCEWCHLVSCRCLQPWCSSHGRPEWSVSLCHHQQTHQLFPFSVHCTIYPWYLSLQCPDLWLTVKQGSQHYLMCVIVSCADLFLLAFDLLIGSATLMVSFEIY